MGHFPSHPVSQGVYFYRYLKVQFPIHINKSDVLSHSPDYLFTYGLRDVIISCFWETVLCNIPDPALCQTYTLSCIFSCFLLSHILGS